jgi:hypothetical protein
MIWADRIGLGLAALLALYTVYFIPSSLRQNQNDWVGYHAKVDACENYKKSHPKFAAIPSTREEYVMQRVHSFNTPCYIKPEKPEVLTFTTQVTLIFKLLVFRVLPLWIFLRGIDFGFKVLRKRQVRM